jgi:cell division protein FtsX
LDIWYILWPFVYSMAICVFYGHLVYLMAKWYFLSPFVNLHSGNLLYFPRFGE